MNGDAIFDFNLKRIFKGHIINKSDLTFIGTENNLAYGTLGIKINRIVSFERILHLTLLSRKKIKTLSHMFIQECLF